MRRTRAGNQVSEEKTYCLCRAATHQRRESLYVVALTRVPNPGEVRQSHANYFGENMSSISIGKTTFALRQKLARAEEFCLTGDQSSVLALIQENGYYQIHPKETARRLGWVVHRASRVIDEVAEAFELTPVKIKSPFGEFHGFQWGAWVESASWPVVAWWDGGQWVEGTPPAEDISPGLSYSPVSTKGKATVSATVSVPVPPIQSSPQPVDEPVDKPVDPSILTKDKATVSDTVSASRREVTEAAARAKAGTMMRSQDAAVGMIRYAMKAHALGPTAAADALISLSSSGRVVTRESLDEFLANPLDAEPEEVTQDRLDAMERTEARIQAMIAAHPEVSEAAVFLSAVNDYRPVKVSLLEADRWYSQARSEARCEFTAQDVYDAVALVHSRGRSLDPLTVGQALRAVATPVSV